MRTFLNVPILYINFTYQMCAHRSCVILFTNSEQVQDIELYDTSVGDDLGAKSTNSSN